MVPSKKNLILFSKKNYSTFKNTLFENSFQNIDKDTRKKELEKRIERAFLTLENIFNILKQ